MVFSLFFFDEETSLSSGFLVALERNEQAPGKQLSQEISTVTTSALIYTGESVGLSSRGDREAYVRGTVGMQP